MLSWKRICSGRTTHGAGIAVGGRGGGERVPALSSPAPCSRERTVPLQAPDPTAHPDAATNHRVTDAEPSPSTFFLGIREGSPTGATHLENDFLNVSSIVLITESRRPSRRFTGALGNSSWASAFCREGPAPERAWGPQGRPWEASLLPCGGGFKQIRTPTKHIRLDKSLKWKRKGAGR